MERTLKPSAYGLGYNVKELSKDHKKLIEAGKKAQEIHDKKMDIAISRDFNPEVMKRLWPSR